MLMTTTTMMMMRLFVSEMCFSGLLSNRIAVSKFEQSGSKQQDQLIHTLDEYADCIDVGRDMEDDLLRYNIACVCCGYDQLTLENGCCRSTPVSRSGQLCSCRIPDALSERKTISPWTRLLDTALAQPWNWTCPRKVPSSVKRCSLFYDPDRR